MKQTIETYWGKKDKSKEESIKSMIQDYRKMVTAISKVDLSNIEVGLNIHFSGDVSCEITIFSKNTRDSFAMTTYSFYSPEENKKIFENAIKLINYDDYYRARTEGA